jgi:Nucleotidyltransferase
MRVRGFVQALKALGPRLDELVLAGGWAWYLYRKYLIGERSIPSEFTFDVDIVVPRRLPSHRPQLDHLLAESDFESEMKGNERPPVTRYSWPSTKNAESTVEFLTPALSSGKDATLEVSGIVAQQLRYINLLMHDPLGLEVEEGSGEERFSGAVRVPRVGLFIWQKALTFPKRHDRAKRSKDLLYIFDLADNSVGLLSRIENDIQAFPSQGRVNWRRRAAENLEAECGDADSPGIGVVLGQIPEESRPPRRFVQETFADLISVLRA